MLDISGRRASCPAEPSGCRSASPIESAMSRDIVYFDLETQRTANDAGGWDRKGNMQMSVGVTYSTRNGRYEIFHESRVHDLIERLRQADLVVGFNLLNFDYHVLMGYTVLDLAHELPTADLMLDMEAKLGHRLGLDAIAHATLGVRKTAASLDAIRWWREGRILEIAEYCCFDVKVTRLLHEHGCRHKELFFNVRFARRQRVEVDWQHL
jgi:DEAD/DEAH box helicase domain-containing protein